MKTINLLKYGIINLILLLVTFGISYFIVMQNHEWLTEELILGIVIVIVPAITFGVGCVVAVIARGMGIVPNFLYVLPVVVLSLWCGFLMLSNGKDLVNYYQNSQTAQQQVGANGGNDRFQSDAPDLPNTAFFHQESNMPAELELRDIQELPDNKDYFWVRYSKPKFLWETYLIGMFNGKTYKFSPLKTQDELWADVQNFQNQNLGGYSDVRWNLKDSEIVFVGKGSSHPNYHVHLATDGSIVQIDSVKTGS